MFFVNTIQTDIPPEPCRVHLLRGLEFHSSLSFNEIMGITNSPYSNENWTKLAYFVTKSSLRPYYNDHIGRIAERYIANGDWLIDKTSINCLFYETCLRMPTGCDWTRNFLFFTPDNFLGSLGAYALQLSTDTSKHMALRQIAKVAQYQLVSNSPFSRFMVAIQKENNWELAFGEILPRVTPIMYTKARRVIIFLYKEPSKLFRELLNGGKISNIPYDEYEVSVRIQY